MRHALHAATIAIAFTGAVYAEGNARDFTGYPAPIAAYLQRINPVDQGQYAYRDDYHPGGFAAWQDAADHFDRRWGVDGHRFYSGLMWPFVMDSIRP